LHRDSAQQDIDASTRQHSETSAHRHNQSHINTSTHHQNHQHIITSTQSSTHQHINNTTTSTHQHINLHNTPTHQHININTSTHQHINTQHISTPTHQHININTSTHQRTNTVINTSTYTTHQHTNASTHQHITHQHIDASTHHTSTQSSTHQLRHTDASTQSSTHQHSHQHLNTVINAQRTNTSTQCPSHFRPIRSLWKGVNWKLCVRAGSNPSKGFCLFSVFFSRKIFSVEFASFPHAHLSISDITSTDQHININISTRQTTTQLSRSRQHIYTSAQCHHHSGWEKQRVFGDE
jgi:hypothetical protein